MTYKNKSESEFRQQTVTNFVLRKTKQNDQNGFIMPIIQLNVC